MNEEKKVSKSTPKKSTTKKTSTKSTTTKTSKASKTSGTKKTTAKTVSSKKTSGTKTSTASKTTKKVSSTQKKTGTKKSASPKKTSTKVVVPEKEKIVVPEEVTTKKEVKQVLEETVLPIKEENLEQEKSEKKSVPVFETRKTIKKVIPVSNYLIAAIVVVWVIIIAYVGYELSRRHQENLYQEGYFIHEKVDVKKISLEEAKTVTHDSKDATFILFNYRGYKETYDLEKELWKIMKDYHIESNFYYVDLTDENGTNNCDMTCVINTGLNHTKFKNVPAVAYYERGSLVDIAQREDQKVLEAADFVKLLDMYEFRK